MFPVEDIPDPAVLFRWLYPGSVAAGRRIKPNAFRMQGSGVSTYWKEYSTAEWCKSQCRDDVGVLRVVAGEARLEGFQVVHTPRAPHNRSHADIRGVEVKLRSKLAKIAHIEIDPPSLE